MAYAVASHPTRHRAGTEFGQGLRAALRVAQEPARAALHPDPSPEDLISPELALVCPELRRQAIEALPDRDPDCFVPRRQQPDTTLRLVSPESVVEVRRRGAALVVAATSRIAVETAKTTAFGVVAFAAVTGLVTLATVLPGA